MPVEPTKQIVVLGAGMVGRAIIADLAQESNFQVTAVDLNPASLDLVARATAARTRPGRYERRRHHRSPGR